MIAIRRSEVPRYLRRSAFYLNLNVEESEFSVPEKCFKLYPSIQSEFDFYHLLNVIKYWGLDSPPLELISFVMDTNLSRLKNENPSTWNLFSSMNFAENLMHLHEYSSDARVEFALRSHMPLLLIQRLVHVGHKIPHNVNEIASRCGYGPMLTHNTTQDALCRLDVSISALAAQSGYLYVLQLLNEANAPWDASVATAAACGGHLDCLKYLHEQGCPWSHDAFKAAFFHLHRDCMMYCQRVHPILRYKHWFYTVRALLLCRLLICYFYPQLGLAWVYWYCFRTIHNALMAASFPMLVREGPELRKTMYALDCRLFGVHMSEEEFERSGRFLGMHIDAASLYCVYLDLLLLIDWWYQTGSK